MVQRRTIQCKLVLETVKRLHHHATADEVYAEVSKDYPAISRGTVYRNLQRLVQFGEVRKIDVPDGADCYDDTTKSHYHVVCTECGKLFDVDMEYIDGLEKGIRDAHGFVFTSCEIIFKGICPECQKKII